MFPTALSRRDWLSQGATGLAGIAATYLLGRDELRADDDARSLPAGLHHPPKANRVIQLFMNGGASQMDLFDYKPELAKQHGQKFDPGTSEKVEAATSEPGNVLRCPFTFKQHGQSGRWISDQLPHLAEHVDQIAFLLAMTSRTNVHGPASFLMNTGFLLPGFPSMGAWVSYALGSLSDNLPTFVVLPDSKGLPYNQRGNFTAGFLPVMHQGTVIQSNGGEPIAHLRAPGTAQFVTAAAEREGLELLERANQRHRQATADDSRLDARIKAYQLAARMQISAPEVFDLSHETEATRRLYGLDNPATEDFGRRCLLARRMIERGVRMVQVWSGSNGASGNWDNHSSIIKELPPMAAATDKPVAALLSDLKQRGLFADTLLLWNTEFGRMPFSQSSEGRDHNGGAFAGWMAGAGIRGGISYGETDEWSWRAKNDIVTTYDFHATVLHLLGINHEHLSVRHNGANRRLTDVHGHVVQHVLS